MPLDGKMFWFAIPIFIGFVAVEMLTLRYFGRSGYSWRESLATIGVWVGIRCLALYGLAHLARCQLGYGIIAWRRSRWTRSGACRSSSSRLNLPTTGITALATRSAGCGPPMRSTIRPRN